MHLPFDRQRIETGSRTPISSPVGKITMIFLNTGKKNKLFSEFGLIIYLQFKLKNKK